MPKFIRIFPAAAAVFFASAVCAFASADTANTTGKSDSTDNDTILIHSVAVGPQQILSIPASPDSTDAAINPFSSEKFFETIRPLSKNKADKAIAKYTSIDTQKEVVVSLPKEEGDNRLSLRRIVTRITPSKFFKGEILAKTPSMIKGYLNGKEFMSKTSFDDGKKATKGALTLQPSEEALLEFHILSEDWTQMPEFNIVPDKDSSGATFEQGPDIKSNYNLFTIVDGERISTADLSPDGNFILICESYCEDGVNSEKRYYVIERQSKKMIADNLQPDAAWLPGKPATLYYSEETRKHGNALMSMEIPSLKSSIIAEEVPENALGGTISPDASFILYYNKIEGKKDEGIMRRLQSPDDRQPSRRTNYYLSLFDLKKSTDTQITFGGPSTYLLDISPDSKKILYSSTRETPEKFPFYESIVVEMDLKTLRTDTIRGFDSSLTEAIYSPDGRRLLIAAGPNAFDGIGLNAGNFTWGNDYDIQLFIADLNNAKLSDIRPMTRDFDPSVASGIIWNKTDGQIYFTAQKGYDLKLFRLNPISGNISEIPTDVDYVRSWSVSRDKPDYIAYTGLGYNYSGKAYLLNAKTGKSVLIDDPNSKYMSRVSTGESSMWSFDCPAEIYSVPDTIAKFPTNVECTYTLPPDFDASRKYPMIVYYYGGTTPTTHTNHSPYTPNLLASRGYVVLTLNPSGTTGYGQEFSARHVNAWGERTADEIIHGVRKFCEEHPYVDINKIGCIGASYGGFMTQLLQTKTDLFAAAVSHAGISNITSYWGEGWWGYSYNSVAAARSYPWNNPKLFTENSPLFNADKIHTPLLLLHGNRDTNVPIGESIQLYNALKILGHDVEFITIDGSDHIVLDFQQRKEWHATIMAWFEKWLKGDDRWWNEIYK